jgi:pimeloyl-ACP methyl ester carboxylesterase
MIEHVSGPIDYDEIGQGPTVVLVPGSCSTGAAWRPVIAEWEKRYRCVTTSLPGYGGTAERRSLSDADIANCAEVVEAVIERAEGPVHLVGHSFGGLTALAVALRNKVPLLSLTIAEAPVPNILPHHGEHAHYRAFNDMTDAYVAAAFDGGDEEAIAQMIDFYGGQGAFADLPPRVRDYVIRSTPSNILDWRSVYGFDSRPALLARMDLPTLVFWGENSHPAVQCANGLMGACIPHARVAVVNDARHFMISTHASETARLISDHVSSVQ